MKQANPAKPPHTPHTPQINKYIKVLCIMVIILFWVCTLFTKKINKTDNKEEQNSLLVKDGPFIFSKLRGEAPWRRKLATRGCFSSVYPGCDQDLVSALGTAPVKTHRHTLQSGGGEQTVKGLGMCLQIFLYSCMKVPAGKGKDGKENKESKIILCQETVGFCTLTLCKPWKLLQNNKRFPSCL